MILVKEKITDVLLQIGVRTDLLGFNYIADILKICNKDPEALHSGMIRLYKMVGKLHNQPVYVY